jgi:hypothetical protein
MSVQAHRRAGAGLLLAGLLLAATLAPRQPDEVPLSPAQILLFNTPHLKAIDHPVFLEHSFHRSGPGAFDDRVVERIDEAHPDGTKHVSVDFLSEDVSIAIDGRIFADDARFANLPAVQNKTYVFVLADAIPGMMQDMRVKLPADPLAGTPALREELVFTGERP